MKKVSKIIVVLLIIIFLVTGCGGNNEYVSKDQYSQLNIQELHND